jgi:hypothetical protein
MTAHLEKGGSEAYNVLFISGMSSLAPPSARLIFFLNQRDSCAGEDINHLMAGAGGGKLPAAIRPRSSSNKVELLGPGSTSQEIRVQKEGR